MRILFSVWAVLGAGLACGTGFGDDSAQPLTYSKDVAPIFNAHCVLCHRMGEIAPMSLITYREARPWAKSIAQKVGAREMPPWHADPAYGTFNNERRLTDEQIQTIVGWVDQGAPMGNPDDLPPAPEFDEGWKLGEPDYVIELPEVRLPAGGPDVFPDLPIALELEKDEWLRALEVRPSNRRVVHHVVLYVGDKSMPEGWLGVWASGVRPIVFPEGMGRMIQAGGRITADMHYHTTDEPTSDRTRIGLHFGEGAMAKEVGNLWVINQSFSIPAGAPDHEVRANYVFSEDSHILALFPHMHYRGKDFTYTATYPDGREEVLLHVPAYDFNWQTVYYLEERLAVPKGTRIDCVAHFDNSADNPANPDPTKTVLFGDESYDEMMVGFIDYIVDEGVRPDAGEVRLTRKGRELAEEFLGEVYRIRLAESDGGLEAVLHLPPEGGGTCHVAFRGILMSGRIDELHWTESTFEGVLAIVGLGGARIFGTVDGESGTLRGRLIEPDETDGSVLEGRRID